MNQKGSVNIIFVIVSLAIVGGLSYLAVTVKPTIKVPNAKDNNIEISTDWVIYSFKNFTFQYPPNWSIKPEDINWPPGNPVPEKAAVRIAPKVSLPTIKDSILIGKFGLPGGYSENCPELKVDEDFKCDDSKGIAVTTYSSNREILDVFNKLISTIVSSNQTSMIKIISPDGGEQWIAGETYDIVWTGEGPTRLTLVIGDYKQCEYIGVPATCVTPSTILATTVSTENGKYSWKIPENLILGDKFKVWLEDGHIIYDASDDYFSIVSSNQTLATDICDSLKGQRFRSVKQYPDVLRPYPESAAMAYRFVNFSDDNKFGYIYADVVESGTYTCKNNVIEVNFLNRKVKGFFDFKREILNWQGEEYRPNPLPS